MSILTIRVNANFLPPGMVLGSVTPTRLSVPHGGAGESAGQPPFTSRNGFLKKPIRLHRPKGQPLSHLPEWRSTKLRSAIVLYQPFFSSPFCIRSWSIAAVAASTTSRNLRCSSRAPREYPP